MHLSQEGFADQFLDRTGQSDIYPRRVPLDHRIDLVQMTQDENHKDYSDKQANMTEVRGFCRGLCVANRYDETRSHVHEDAFC